MTVKVRTPQKSKFAVRTTTDQYSKFMEHLKFTEGEHSMIIEVNLLTIQKTYCSVTLSLSFICFCSFYNDQDIQL